MLLSSTLPQGNPQTLRRQEQHQETEEGRQVTGQRSRDRVIGFGFALRRVARSLVTVARRRKESKEQQQINFFFSFYSVIIIIVIGGG